MRDLEQLEAVDSVDGAVALIIASRLDRDVDSGAGIASLSKVLTTCMQRIYAEHEREDTPLTQFRQRRHLRGVEPVPRDEDWDATQI